MQGVVKRREPDGKLTPLAENLFLRVVCHHKVLDVEARTLDALIKHHRAPTLHPDTGKQSENMHSVQSGVKMLSIVQKY